MGKRVLVADDSATIQRAFAMVFGAQADIALIPARSLDEAISAARQGRPDLVIADANLGNRTGYDLCSAVKSDPALRGVPVVILASNHTPYDEARGRDAGADGHLLKPFESQGIIDKVNEILSRVVAAPAAAPAATRDPHLGVTPAAARPAPRLAPPAAAADDDDYGEFKIERSSGSSPVPAGVRPAPAPASPPPAASPFGAGFGSSIPAAASRPTAAPSFGQSPFGSAAPSVPSGPPAAAAGLRPSLIPGARPGMPPRMPSAAPPPGAAARPSIPSGSPTPSHAPPSGFGQAGLGSAPVSSSAANPGRTIMGLPAVAIPGMAPRAPAGAPGGPLSPVTPPPTPGLSARPSPSVPAPPLASVPPPAAPATREPARQPAIDIGAAISARRGDMEQRLDQKVAAISAKGPEYEAIAKLSREVIEQVVWEVVPELAETIIREHVERLAASRK